MCDCTVIILTNMAYFAGLIGPMFMEETSRQSVKGLLNIEGGGGSQALAPCDPVSLSTAEPNTKSISLHRKPSLQEPRKKGHTTNSFPC